jgi:hypothetical protein
MMEAVSAVFRALAWNGESCQQILPVNAGTEKDTSIPDIEKVIV